MVVWAKKLIENKKGNHKLLINMTGNGKIQNQQHIKDSDINDSHTNRLCLDEHHNLLSVIVFSKVLCNLLNDS